LKKIKELVEIVVKKVRSVETNQFLAADQLRIMKDQQSVMNEKLDTMQESLDSHSTSLIEIEGNLKGYADMYKVNKVKIEKLESKVEIISKKISSARN